MILLYELGVSLEFWFGNNEASVDTGFKILFRLIFLLLDERKNRDRLKMALFNLEKNKLDEIEEEEKKNKQFKLIVGIVSTVVILIGVIVFIAYY